MAHRMNQTAALIVVSLTAALFAVLIPFASHRSWLLWMSTKCRESIRTAWPEAELPRVTIQLPMYNERAVAARVIDACCALDYPRDRFEVQVLDDSDDGTSLIVAERVDHWQSQGVVIQQLRRSDRRGFKAGALAEGVKVATGDFFLVFDADFVPAPDVLRRLLTPLQDERVGMVQGAWAHLNREANWLTRAQSFLLDGHFLFEQRGRYAGGRFFNFNGTAGIWRRTCLEEAGGWRADTLTEDLDLSYRAQMAGWNFVYLDDVTVPAEIPSTVDALYVQQRRWAQGGIQTGRLILPKLLAASYPMRIKTEGIVHLLGHVAHPLTWMLALLLFPSAVARRSLGLDHLLGFDLVLFGAATVPFCLFYWMAGEGRHRPRRGRIVQVLKTLALGIGLSVPVSRAVVRGVTGARTPFERTPKQGGEKTRRYRPPISTVDAIVQLGMATLLLSYLVLAVAGGYWGQLPFILLFLSGYATLGALGAAQALDSFRQEERPNREPHRGAEPAGLRPSASRVVGRQPEVAEEWEAA